MEGAESHCPLSGYILLNGSDNADDCPPAPPPPFPRPVSPPTHRAPLDDKVDHRAFVSDFLPQFLDTYYPWLGAAQKEALVSPWRAGTHLDVPTFSSFLEAFVSDLAFFRAQAEAG